MLVPRFSTNKLLKLASLYPVVLITGARQVGKTELAKKCFPNHKWILLDSVTNIELAKKDPALFLDNYRGAVILDEIQRVPELFLEIKNRVDSGLIKKGELILTGSQPLILMQHASDSLAGRIGILELGNLTPSEIDSRGENFRDFLEVVKSPELGKVSQSPIPIYESLLRGNFPAMALLDKSPSAEDGAIRLEDYVKTFIERDLRELSVVHNLGLFEKFMRVIAISSSRLTNLNESAGEISLPQSTAFNWLGLLKASLLVKEIPAYHGTYIKRESKRAKLILSDSGLMVSLIGFRAANQIQNSPLLGAIFETAVINSIHNSLLLNPARKQIFHWRSGENREIDLIIETPEDEIVAVEIKTSSTIKKDFVNNILNFRESTKKKVYGVLVSSSPEILMIEKGVLNLPWWVI